jgi:hypothetical protein
MKYTLTLITALLVAIVPARAAELVFVAEQPYAINWAPVRHITPRMAGLHPDSQPPKVKKKRANDLDLN